MEKEKARRQAEQEAEELRMTIKVRKICGAVYILECYCVLSCYAIINVIMFYNDEVHNQCEVLMYTLHFQIQSWWRGVMVRRQLGPYSKKKKKKGKKGKKSGKKGKKKK